GRPQPAGALLPKGVVTARSLSQVAVDREGSCPVDHISTDGGGQLQALDRALTHGELIRHPGPVEETVLDSVDLRNRGSQPGGDRKRAPAEEANADSLDMDGVVDALSSGGSDADVEPGAEVPATRRREGVEARAGDGGDLNPPGPAGEPSRDRPSRQERAHCVFDHPRFEQALRVPAVRLQDEGL